jgi:hypothetical protein
MALITAGYINAPGPGGSPITFDNAGADRSDGMVRAPMARQMTVRLLVPYWPVQYAGAVRESFSSGTPSRCDPGTSLSLNFAEGAALVMAFAAVPM